MAPPTAFDPQEDLIHYLEFLQESATFQLLQEGKKAVPVGYCRSMGKSKVYIYIKTADPKDPWKHFGTPGTPKGDAALAKSAAWDKAAEKADALGQLVGKPLTSADDLKTLSDAQKKKLQDTYGEMWPEEVSDTLDDLSKFEKELVAGHAEWSAEKGAPKAKAKKADKAAPAAPDLDAPPPVGTDVGGKMPDYPDLPFAPPAEEPPTAPKEEPPPPAAEPPAAEKPAEHHTIHPELVKTPGKDGNPILDPDAPEGWNEALTGAEEDATAGEDSPEAEFAANMHAVYGPTWKNTIMAAAAKYHAVPPEQVKGLDPAELANVSVEKPIDISPPAKEPQAEPELTGPQPGDDVLAMLTGEPAATPQDPSPSEPASEEPGLSGAADQIHAAIASSLPSDSDHELSPDEVQKHLTGTPLGDAAWFLHGPEWPAKVAAAMAVQHPQKDERGRDQKVYFPSKPSDPSTWTKADATATFIPGGEVPEELHGVPLKPWEDAPKTKEDWAKIADKPELDEPAFDPGSSAQAGAGMIVMEPDGRVWVVKPTNEFGDSWVFPKGGMEKGLSTQQVAAKETFEELGIQAEPITHLGDVTDPWAKNRYYLAVRKGGTPADMGWESQSAKLVPLSKLRSMFLGGREQDVLDHLEAALQAGKVPGVNASSLGGTPKIPTTIPSVDDLTIVAKPAGGVDYEDEDGQRYSYRSFVGSPVAQAKALGAEAVASLALTIRGAGEALPVRSAKDEKGEWGTITPKFPRAYPTSPDSVSGLTAKEVQDLSQELLAEWLTGTSSTGLQGFGRTRDGGLVAYARSGAFRFLTPDAKLQADKTKGLQGKFWEYWLQGKLNPDFDPQSLLSSIQKVEALPDSVIEQSAQRYFDALPEDAKKANPDLVANAVARKNAVRADYETFLTDLYRKKTGEENGSFTFEGGWKTGAVEPAPETPPAESPFENPHYLDAVLYQLPAGADPTDPEVLRKHLENSGFGDIAKTAAGDEWASKLAAVFQAKAASDAAAASSGEGLTLDDPHVDTDALDPDEVPVSGLSSDDIDAMAKEYGEEPSPESSLFLDPSEPTPQETPPVPGTPTLKGPEAAPSDGWPATHYSDLAELVKGISAAKGKTSDAMLKAASSPEFLQKYGEDAADAINAIRVALGKPAYLKLPGKTLTQGELESLTDIIATSPDEFKTNVASGKVVLSKSQLHAANAMLATIGHGPVPSAAPKESPAVDPKAAEASATDHVVPPEVTPKGIGGNDHSALVDALAVLGDSGGKVLKFKGPELATKLAAQYGDKWFDVIHAAQAAIHGQYTDVEPDLADPVGALAKVPEWAQDMEKSFGPEWKEKLAPALKAVAASAGGPPVASSSKPAAVSVASYVDPSEFQSSAAKAYLPPSVPDTWAENLDDLVKSASTGSGSTWAKGLAAKYGPAWKNKVLAAAGIYFGVPPESIPGHTPTPIVLPPEDVTAMSGIASLVNALHVNGYNYKAAAEDSFASADKLEGMFGQGSALVAKVAADLADSFKSSPDPVKDFLASPKAEHMKKALGSGWPSYLHQIAYELTKAGYLTNGPEHPSGHEEASATTSSPAFDPSKVTVPDHFDTAFLGSGPKEWMDDFDEWEEMANKGGTGHCSKFVNSVKATYGADWKKAAIATAAKAFGKDPAAALADAGFEPSAATGEIPVDNSVSDSTIPLDHPALANLGSFTPPELTKVLQGYNTDGSPNPLGASNSKKSNDIALGLAKEFGPKWKKKLADTLFSPTATAPAVDSKLDYKAAAEYVTKAQDPGAALDQYLQAGSPGMVGALGDPTPHLVGAMMAKGMPLTDKHLAAAGLKQDTASALQALLQTSSTGGFGGGKTLADMMKEPSFALAMHTSYQLSPDNFRALANAFLAAKGQPLIVPPGDTSPAAAPSAGKSDTSPGVGVLSQSKVKAAFAVSKTPHETLQALQKLKLGPADEQTALAQWLVQKGHSAAAAKLLTNPKIKAKAGLPGDLTPIPDVYQALSDLAHSPTDSAELEKEFGSDWMTHYLVAWHDAHEKFVGPSQDAGHGVQVSDFTGYIPHLMIDHDETPTSWYEALTSAEKAPSSSKPSLYVAQMKAKHGDLWKEKLVHAAAAYYGKADAIPTAAHAKLFGAVASPKLQAVFDHPDVKNKVSGLDNTSITVDNYKESLKNYQNGNAKGAESGFWKAVEASYGKGQEASFLADVAAHKTNGKSKVHEILANPEASGVFGDYMDPKNTLATYAQSLADVHHGMASGSVTAAWAAVKKAYGPDGEQAFLNDLASIKGVPQIAAPQPPKFSSNKVMSAPSFAQAHQDEVLVSSTSEDFLDWSDAVMGLGKDWPGKSTPASYHKLKDELEPLYGSAWQAHLLAAKAEEWNYFVPPKAAQTIAGTMDPATLNAYDPAYDVYAASMGHDASSVANNYMKLNAADASGKSYPGLAKAKAELGHNWAHKLALQSALASGLPIDAETFSKATAAAPLASLDKVQALNYTDKDILTALHDLPAEEVHSAVENLVAAVQKHPGQYPTAEGFLTNVKSAYGFDVDGFVGDLAALKKSGSFKKGTPAALPSVPKTTKDAPIPASYNEASLYPFSPLHPGHNKANNQLSALATNYCETAPSTLKTWLANIDHNFSGSYPAQSLKAALGDEWKESLAKAYAANLTSHYAPGPNHLYDQSIAKSSQSVTFAKHPTWFKGHPYKHDIMKAALIAAKKKTVLSKVLFGSETLSDADYGTCQTLAGKIMSATANGATDEEAAEKVLTPAVIAKLKSLGPAWPHVVNTFLAHEKHAPIPHLPSDWMDPQVVLDALGMGHAKPSPTAKSFPSPSTDTLTQAAAEKAKVAGTQTVPATTTAPKPVVAPPQPPPPPAQVKAAQVVTSGAPPAKKAAPKDAPPEGFKPAPMPKAKEAPQVGSIPSLPQPKAPIFAPKADKTPISSANEAIQKVVSHVGGADAHLLTSEAGSKWVATKPVNGVGELHGPGAASSADLFHSVAAFVKPGLGYARSGPDHMVLHPVTSYGDPPTLDGIPPSALTDSELEDVAGEHVLDWLMGHHGSHGGALARTSDGRILGTAKTNAFQYAETDRLSLDYTPGGPGAPKPYYNRFWQDWADGKHDFDPMKLKAHIESVESIDPAGYTAALQNHFSTVYPGKADQVYDAVQNALYRKAGMRAEFERFLTDLYRERTGETKGAFSFDEGWIGKPAEPYEVPISLSEHLKSSGVEEAIYQDYSVSPPAADASKLTLKVSKSADISAIQKTLADAGITSSAPVMGSINQMVFVDKAAYMAAQSGKTQIVYPAKAAINTPKRPRYFPKVYKPAAVTKTAGDLQKLDAHTCHYTGQVYHLDGGALEGQTVKAKKLKDKKGNDDGFLFSFKLRKPAWKDLASKGTAGTYTFQQGLYDAASGALQTTGTHIDDTATRVWMTGDSEVHLATGSDGKYAYQGSVYVKVKPKPGQDPKTALHEALEGVKTGLGKELLREPTEEDKELARLSRLHWARAPQAADKFAAEELKSPGIRTIAKMKELLYKAGVTDDEMSRVVEREVYPGHFTHVLPGRSKKMKARMLFQGINNIDGALNVAKAGIMGIHERNLAGFPQVGGSYGDDVRSGSGDGTLCRIATDAAFSSNFSGHSFKGQYQAIIAPDELDRLDAYYQASDCFGACNPADPHGGSEWSVRDSVEDGVKGLQSYHKGGNEISFRKGINRGRILRLACQSESARQAFITQAKSAGLHEINGVPVEDYCVVADNIGDVYQKYVKPLGY